MYKLEKMVIAVSDPNVVLRDPISKKRVTTSGMLVPKNRFWIRRLKAGDCYRKDLTVAEAQSAQAPANEGIE